MTVQSLLEEAAQLTRNIEQIELCFLKVVVGVQKGEPFVIFLNSSILDFAQARAAFLEIRLHDLEIFLRQLQFQARDLTPGIKLAKAPVLAYDIQFNVLSPSINVLLGNIQLASGERNVRGSLCTDDRNLNV